MKLCSSKGQTTNQTDKVVQQYHIYKNSDND